MKQYKYTTRFVENLPMLKQEGVLYVTPHFNCAMHKCMCGCGKVIYTPIESDRGGWEWMYDGKNVSLSPSVDNSNCECGSHYFLKNGEVQWC